MVIAKGESSAKLVTGPVKYANVSLLLVRFTGEWRAGERFGAFL